TDLVAEALDDDRPVVRQVTGGGALLLEEVEQGVRGPSVEPGLGEAGGRSLRPQSPDLPHEGSDGTSEPDPAPDLVPVPEGQPTRLPRSGGDEDLVVGDVLDPPRARPEGEDVADPGLVDHLLVELSDAPAGPGAG